MKAVIFDVEGTLLDVIEALYFQYEHITAEYDGAKVSREAIRASAHGTPGQVLRELVGTTDAPFETVTQRHQALRAHAYKEYVKPYAAADELLPLLKALGYKVGAVTHGDEHTLAALERAGMRRHFDAVVTAENMPRLHPHADSVRVVLDKLGASPEETVFIGDAVNEVLAAKNAGIPKVIAVTHGLSSADALRAAGADRLVGNIPAVLDVIG